MEPARDRTSRTMSSKALVPSLEDPTLRLYAIVRADLNMPVGKIASQTGHAYLDSYFNARDLGLAEALEYRSEKPGTKVALAAPSLAKLLDAQRAAEALGLPNALIIDSGHILPPHFDGNPIVTALGIGPARRHQVHSITKRFPSLR